nr:hypothetical protein [Paracoccus mutanolyticus]
MNQMSPNARDIRAALKDPDLFREAALIDGEWLARADMEVLDPATGAVLGRMPDCTAAETQRPSPPPKRR